MRTMKDVHAKDAAIEGVAIGKKINSFELRPAICSSAIAGSNLVLVGDAVGNGHWTVGGGVQIATAVHAPAIGELADAIIQEDDITEALENYNRKARQGTVEWLIKGMESFFPATLSEKHVMFIARDVLEKHLYNPSKNLSEEMKNRISEAVKCHRKMQDNIMVDIKHTMRLAGNSADTAEAYQ